MEQAPPLLSVCATDMKLTINQKRKAGVARAAFTLVEVMIAVVITAIMFASLNLGLGQGFAIIKGARENLRATQILQERMETIRLYTWEQLCAKGFVPDTFTCAYDAAGTATNSGLVYNGQITISPAPMTECYAADHKLVTVDLTWASGNTQRQRQISTIVSRYGLHNYYY